MKNTSFSLTKATQFLNSACPLLHREDQKMAEQLDVPHIKQLLELAR